MYVVELSDEVWNVARFRRANPAYQLGKPFVYVGMTGLDPDVRFDKHKAGIQSNVFARKFGLRLLPKLLHQLKIRHPCNQPLLITSSSLGQFIFF